MSWALSVGCLGRWVMYLFDALQNALDDALWLSGRRVENRCAWVCSFGFGFVFAVGALASSAGAMPDHG
jgi:hypothetical protein